MEDYLSFLFEKCYHKEKNADWMEDVMFKEYLRQYRHEITEGNCNNGICFDGAVNSELFFSNSKRLMFLLKETNGNEMNGKRNSVTTDWDYMAWVQKQANCEEKLYRSAFRNIAMWSRQFELYSLASRL